MLTVWQRLFELFRFINAFRLLALLGWRFVRPLMPSRLVCAGLTLKSLHYGLLMAVPFYLSACQSVQAPQPMADHVTIQERAHLVQTGLDKLIEQHIKPNEPGIAVGIWDRDGHPIYQRYHGMADVYRKIPIDAHTSFNIASLTKQMTATAVLQLVQSNQLTLNDSVTQWIPSLPESWSAVTIHHLLSHQSGIPECCSGVNVYEFQRFENTTNSELVEQITTHQMKLVFPPGSQTKYSNTNYILLAQLIEAVSGQRYSQYVQQHIFSPAMMSESYFLSGNAPKGVREALNFGRASKIYYIDVRLQGAFDVYSTVTDVGKFLRALNGGQLLNQENLALMTQNHGSQLSNKSIQHYGYGWQVESSGQSTPVFWHTGSMEGFKSIDVVYRETGVTEVILSNAGLPTDKLVNPMLVLVRSAYFKAPTTPPPSEGGSTPKPLEAVTGLIAHVP